MPKKSPPSPINSERKQSFSDHLPVTEYYDERYGNLNGVVLKVTRVGAGRDRMSGGTGVGYVVGGERNRIRGENDGERRRGELFGGEFRFNGFVRVRTRKRVQTVERNEN